MRISDELLEAAAEVADAEVRTVRQQVEYWARLGRDFDRRRKAMQLLDPALTMLVSQSLPRSSSTREFVSGERARDHFKLIAEGKAETHRLAAEEAAKLDPVDRATLGLKMHRSAARLTGRRVAPKVKDFSLRRRYDAAQRPNPDKTERS